jgi:hypothetical protein
VKMLGVAPEGVQRHEDAAMVVFIGTTLLGVCSLAGYFLYRKTRSMPKGASIGLLVVAGTILILSARAANLGLQIRHPEIRSDAPQLPAARPAEIPYEP